jgi:hypothetical protein
MVMIEYQLVPLFQSISTESQLSNQSTIEFQIELSDTFPNFSASHIEIVGDPGICKPGTLSGNGTSFVYTVTDCVDGEVGISIPENSISVQGYSGPETTKSSEIVAVDQIAPEIIEIIQAESELTISITEAVLKPERENYLLTSSNNACQVDSITAGSDQVWQATLVGCEGSSFSFTILANSVSDLAGNTGPAEDTSFEVVVPAPSVSPTPEPTVAPEPEAAPAPELTALPEPDPSPTPERADLPEPEAASTTEPIASVVSPTTSSVTTPSSVLGVTPQESLVEESVMDVYPVEDSEVTKSPTQRRQAAQSVITASATPETASQSIGWTVGLTIAGALLLAAGLFLRRRGISDLLIS